MPLRVCWTAISATRRERCSLAGGAFGRVAQSIDAAANMKAITTQSRS